jgi:hypothetical protein
MSAPLSENQFGDRLFDPGPAAPAASAAGQDRSARAAAQRDDGLRGETIGQRIMNFDVPEHPLDVGTHHWAKAEAVPFIGVSTVNDPDYRPRMWDYGGAHRQSPGAVDPDANTWASGVTSTWESAPVERIGAFAQVRTGQSSTDPRKVSRLRDAAGAFHQQPWVAQVADKRYLLEGHHRAHAARRSGRGDFDAHVLAAENWPQFQKLFPGKRKPI